MANKKRRSKRKRHAGRKVVGGTALLALLLAGGHFGLGIGQAEGGLLKIEALQATKEAVVDTVEAAPETAETAAETLQAVQEAVIQEIVVPQDDGILTITVRESTLLYEGREVTLAQLEEELLKDYQPDTSTVELRDDHAIKAAYDEVNALLQRLSIPYSTGK